MSEVKKPEIKQVITDLASKLNKYAEIKDGAINFTKEVFDEVLPDGLKRETVASVLHHVQNLATATALVTGEKAVEAFEKDKNLSEVKAVMPLPVGSVTSVNLRETTVRNVATGAETKVNGYVCSPRITLKSSGGQIKAVRNRVAELAEKANIK